MAYETPNTYVTGQVFTNTVWNQDVVNDTIFLHSPPGCRVRNTNSVVISTGVETALTWNTEVFDNAALFDLSGQNDRITAPVDGLYFMMGGISWVNVNVLGRLTIYHSNGERLFHDSTHPDGVVVQDQNTSGYWYMSAGEYIRLFAYQNSGANRTISADSDTPGSSIPQTFGMHWIGGGGV